jgi:hypothetical protein
MFFVYFELENASEDAEACTDGCRQTDATVVYKVILYMYLGLCPCVQSAEHKVSIVLSPAERLTCSPFPFVF